ncbi:hypothetical protein Cal7507_1618 [Calothrix sp. PCC 7507]|nr:hypothetical protein Cal7507_1618 [Calothrix sp. PCC 7507]
MSTPAAILDLALERVVNNSAIGLQAIIINIDSENFVALGGSKDWGKKIYYP